MKTLFQKLILAWMIFLVPGQSFAEEASSLYTTLIYKDERQLAEFNKKALRNIPSRKNRAIADEVTSKLDALIERVMDLLVQTRPAQKLKFRVMLLRSEKDIKRIYSQRYGKAEDYVAFYSPRDNTIYISVEDVRLGVLAHELSHVIVRSFFYAAPTKMVHEAISQFVETRIEKASDR